MGVALDWAATRAAGAGFAGVTVAGEPAGHRWRVLGQLTAQLRCYAPEPVDETWGRLRHLGARREQLLFEMRAASMPSRIG
ncbi:hypothetical protein NONI108955_38270 [Nocardia ninae]